MSTAVAQRVSAAARAAGSRLVVRRGLTAALSLLFSSPAGPLSLGGSAFAQGAAYARAEQLLDWHLRESVFRDSVGVHWLPAERFWYSVTTPEGPTAFLVEARTLTKRRLVDTERLAGAISIVTGTPLDYRRLDFTSVRLLPGDRVVELEAAGRRLRCGIGSYACELLAGGTGSVPSPDGTWEAFIASRNVYLRRAGATDSVRLTTDGDTLWSYGYDRSTYPSVLQALKSAQPPLPAISWSPNSRFLVVQRWDARRVGTISLYSSTSIRPRTYVFPYALPGDSIVDTYSLVVIDRVTGAVVPVPGSVTPFIHGIDVAPDVPGREPVKWSKDSDTLYFVTGSRGSRRLTLMAAASRTGGSRDLVGDTSLTTTIEMSALRQPDWRVLKAGREVLWFSWRDGWGHYYRFDGRGRLINQVTRGPWTVDRVVYVDERRGQLYFTARGVDPARFLYHAYLYRANLDGTGLTLLTPEVGDHVVRVSPQGRFIVDTYSRIDQPPRTVLRAAKDGRILMLLEDADISRLQLTAWTPPQPICMKAADGATDIWGLMYTPSDFDSRRKYPLIDHIYPVPSGGVRRWGFNLGDFQYPRSLAELGFVVVEIAARGTQGRSKGFLDAYQGHIGANTLPDHVAAIRQLARRFSFIDSNRVGVYGFSGGGFAAATALLRYPTLFRVGVAAAGNYDNRSYAAYWAEKFQGLYQRDTASGKDNYEAEAATTLAGALRGKLLLLQGDLDDNTHPAMTLRLVNALIAANKRFDLMIFPDRGHGVALTDPYAIRMTFDYFVTNLLGVAPPDSVAFQPPSGLN